MRVEFRAFGTDCSIDIAQCITPVSYTHLAPDERTPRELLGWSQAAMTQEMAHLVHDIGIPVKYAGQ